MPHVTLNASPGGLTLPVIVGTSRTLTAAILAAGQPIPAPRLLRGMIDTGSNVTCVDSAVLQGFGLSPVRQQTTHTTAGSMAVRLF